MTVHLIYHNADHIKRPLQRTVCRVFGGRVSHLDNDDPNFYTILGVKMLRSWCLTAVALRIECLLWMRMCSVAISWRCGSNVDDDNKRLRSSDSQRKKNSKKREPSLSPRSGSIVRTLHFSADHAQSTSRTPQLSTRECFSRRGHF